MGITGPSDKVLRAQEALGNTATSRATIRCRTSASAPYWLSTQERLSYSCPQRHAAKETRDTGRRHGSSVGHSQKSGLVTSPPDGCAGGPTTSRARPRLAVRYSALWRIRLVQAANKPKPQRSFTAMKQIEGLTASGLSAARGLGCGATSVVLKNSRCKRPLGYPKEED